MAAATIISTSKFLASTPADPSTRSFLDLPPEVRNYIYQLWFQQDTAQLAEVEPGRFDLVERTEADDVAEAIYYQWFRDRRATDSPWNKPQQVQPQRIKHAALSILYVCQQLRYETTPLLYSSKIFIHAPRYDHHDATAKYVDAAPAAWLRQVNPYDSLVYKIVIDLGAIGPSNCRCRGPDQLDTFRKKDGFLHFGSLIDTIWKSERELDISFVDTGPIPKFCSAGTVSGYMSLSSACNAEKLSGVVRQLGEDALGMKKFRRGIADIGIKPNGSGGVFVFRTNDSYTNQRYQNLAFPGSRNPIFDHARYFEVDDNGVLHFSAKEPKTLLGLPEAVIETVVEHVFCLDIVYEIDVDSPDNFRNLYAMFYVHRCMHKEPFTTFLRTRKFNISMTATGALRQFAFRKLQRLLETRFGRRGHQRVVHFGKDVDFSLDLHIHLDDTVSESSHPHPQINLTPFLIATAKGAGSEHVKIILYDRNGAIKEHLTTIDKLRRSALDVLEKYVKVDHATDARIRCPELWMDYYGDTIETVSKGSRPLVRGENSAVKFSKLWHAGNWIRDRGTPPPCPKIDGPARSLYVYVKWCCL